MATGAVVHALREGRRGARRTRRIRRARRGHPPGDGARPGAPASRRWSTSRSAAATSARMRSRSESTLRWPRDTHRRADRHRQRDPVGEGGRHQFRRSWRSSCAGWASRCGASWSSRTRSTSSPRRCARCSRRSTCCSPRAASDRRTTTSPSPASRAASVARVVRHPDDRAACCASYFGGDAERGAPEDGRGRRGHRAGIRRPA